MEGCVPEKDSGSRTFESLGKTLNCQITCPPCVKIMSEVTPTSGGVVV